MNAYWKKNLLPLAVEIAFIISCLVIPAEYFIYTNFLFYFVLLLYFVAVKDFSAKEWGRNLKGGKTFWKPVGITVFFFMLAFAATMILESTFPQLDTGMIGLRRDNWFTLVLFAISTIVLPPVVEETFYRKNLILTENKNVMAVTVVCSMLLYAAEHSLTPWGIFLTMLWALPLSISYGKTKNVFIPMTAHFIVNFIGNGADVVFTIIGM
ncbi:MAG: CPBP family intramembrane metalloprotease [Lachnospiraceae bacterium]|nr:CPBP family intramembrane metalloprotease [Lachnospiraceae bacterium]